MKAFYCPKCGARLQLHKAEDNLVPVCTNATCGFIFWQNAKPTVVVIIPNSEGQVLLTVRDIAPEEGLLDLPGGFLNETELPEDGAVREVYEELGIKIRCQQIFGHYIDAYDRDTATTLNVCFIASIVSGTPIAKDEIREVVWRDAASVTPSELAFTNNEYFLKLWSQTHGQH